MLENMQNILSRISEIKTRMYEIKKESNITRFERRIEKKGLKREESSFERLITSKIKNNNNKTNKKNDNNDKYVKNRDIIKKIEDYSKTHNVDPKLIEAIIEVESGFNPNAVSEKGAIGLMQLMPGTAKMLGVKNPFDIDENLSGGIQYLSDLMKKWPDDIEKVLAAYNAGEGAVLKYGGIPPYEETKNYIKKVMERYNKK